LRVKGKTIAKIEKGRKSEQPKGFVVIPGLIDLHGDMLEREVDMPQHELDKRHTASGITTA
jgi:alpha-D-ribose 1-methylphosphonate 5-triphosphate diphosphatase PhnM